MPVCPIRVIPVLLGSHDFKSFKACRRISVEPRCKGFLDVKQFTSPLE